MKRLGLAILLSLTIGTGLWAVGNAKYHYQPTEPFNTWSGVATLTLKVLDKRDLMEDVEVGVFTKGKNPVLRGVARCDAKNGVWWVSVHGDSTEPMEFHLWDEATGTEKIVDQDWTFVVNGEDGTLADPYLLFWNKPRDLYENSVRINACSLKEKDLDGNGTWSVKADLYNPNENFCGVSFNLVLPKGIKIMDQNYLWVDRGSRTEGKTGVKFDFKEPVVELADSVYRISIINNIDEKVISGTKGDIISIYLKPDVSFAAGVGTLSITNVVLTRLDETTVKGNDYKATIVMDGGGPVEEDIFVIEGQVSDSLLKEITSNDSISSYDLTGAILDDGCSFSPANPNALLFISDEDKDKISSANVVVEGQCNQLILTDKIPFSTPAAFTATTATYTRNITNIGTICLPFAPSTNGFEYYELTDKRTNALYFTKVDIPEADKPYLYRKIGEGNAITSIGVEISNGDAGETAKSGWEMKGTYDTLVFSAADNVYALSGGKLYLNTGTLTIRPFRAYFTYESSGVKSMDIYLDGESTGIQMTEDGQFTTPKSTRHASTFNLAGQLVGNTYTGIVIKNGVKTFQKQDRP